MEVVILKRWCLHRSISIMYKFAREVNLMPIYLLSVLVNLARTRNKAIGYT